MGRQLVRRVPLCHRPQPQVRHRRRTHAGRRREEARRHGHRARHGSRRQAHGHAHAHHPHTLLRLVPPRTGPHAGVDGRWPRGDGRAEVGPERPGLQAIRHASLFDACRIAI